MIAKLESRLSRDESFALAYFRLPYDYKRVSDRDRLARVETTLGQEGERKGEGERELSE